MRHWRDWLSEVLCIAILVALLVGSGYKHLVAWAFAAGAGIIILCFVAVHIESRLPPRLRTALLLPINVIVIGGAAALDAIASFAADWWRTFRFWLAITLRRLRIMLAARTWL